MERKRKAKMLCHSDSDHSPKTKYLSPRSQRMAKVEKKRSEIWGNGVVRRNGGL